MWSVMLPPPEVKQSSAWACLPTQGQKCCSIHGTQDIVKLRSYSFYTCGNGHRDIRGFSEGSEDGQAVGLGLHPTLRGQAETPFPILSKRAFFFTFEFC